MKYLITGGCGFLGSNIVAEVIKRGHDLVVFDNLSRNGSEENLEWLRSQGNVKFIFGDIRNSDNVSTLVKSEKPDVIFHLAGQVAMTTSIEDPRKDFETNALGTLNVLEAVRTNCPGSKIVYSSTNKVYGDLEWLHYKESQTRYVIEEFPDGLPESIPLNFSSPYGCSKGSADQYVLDYSRVYGLKTAVFRHSSMYGGRQFATFDQGWVGWFCEQAIKTKSGTLKEPFTISGNGKQVRDLLHAEDMVRLYLTAAEKIEEINGLVFNIGGGMSNSLSLLELFGILEELLGIKMKFIKLSPRACDQKVFVADIRKAKVMLGWYPQVDSLSGVKKMLEWTNGIVN